MFKINQLYTHPSLKPWQHIAKANNGKTYLISPGCAHARLLEVDFEAYRADSVIYNGQWKDPQVPVVYPTEKDFEGFF